MTTRKLGRAPRPPAHVDDLWVSYTETRSREDRDRLVLHYAGLATYVASRLGTGLPSSVDYADLIQSGIFGLMDAIARFEPERGLKFETYATARIRGAMLDELRALDWAPRSVRTKARNLDVATEAARTRLHRTPKVRDVADELGVAPAEVHRMQAQVGRARVQALDESLFAPSGGESVSLAETLTDPLAELPGDAVDEHDLHEALRAALAELPERSRAVLIHSYIDGLTLAQIGEVLGVTESRVCQLRGQALRQVRASLQARVSA